VSVPASGIGGYLLGKMLRSPCKLNLSKRTSLKAERLPAASCNAGILILPQKTLFSDEKAAHSRRHADRRCLLG
jgi:hypothetical protein